MRIKRKTYQENKEKKNEQNKQETTPKKTKQKKTTYISKRFAIFLKKFACLYLINLLS